MAVSTTYYVIPDDYPLRNYTNSNTFTLQHYLNNTSKYFVSNNQLHFLPGQHCINNDLVFKEIYSFTLTGHGINQSVIICSLSASIVVGNIDRFTMKNILLIDCIILLHNKLYVSVYFSHCGLVIMRNVYVNVTYNAPKALGVIYLTDVTRSIIINVKVQVINLKCYHHPIKIYGLAIYHSSSAKVKSPGVMIQAFNYYAEKSCLQYLQCAIKCMVFTAGSFDLLIENTMFANLSNCSALCYYGRVNTPYHGNIQGIPYLSITNVTVVQNTGYGYLKMFDIMVEYRQVLSNDSNYVIKVESIAGFSQVINFRNCSFSKNSNIETMIHIESVYNVVISIENSTFHNNTGVCFLKIPRHNGVISNVMGSVFLVDVMVSNNDQHYHGDDLICVTNAYVTFSNNAFVDNYFKYNSIIKLQFSMTYLVDSNRINNNKARYIIKAQRGSIFFIQNFATVSIVNNIAYKVVLHENSADNSGVPICPLQFYDTSHTVGLDDLDGINCTLILLNNTEMILKSLPGQFLPFIDVNCTWYERFFFEKLNASAVYHKIVQFNNNTIISKTSERFLPLSVCPCSLNGSYNCYETNLGTIFPGVTLHSKLFVPHQFSRSSSAIIVANTKDDDCSIVDSYQLSQSYPISHGCNNYSYTIWPNSRHTTECKLFIGLSEIPEMFYVQIKPCPAGFTLQSYKKSCYCDPLLLNNDILSIASCNLDDESILRPAKSWISADTNNNSHTYNVSPQCPFDYCLPLSSNLNLTNPDSQCQFKRSGVLCGECQQGLSAVFGSSQCKHCSNLYLFMIIPIAIAGIVLVIMLFIFNLTVTNGIINSLIFYVNIISINYSQFCFKSNSPDCTLLSLMNLDLGIETCFYDGMDGYAKMWLQLVFPSYLIIIAFTLIIVSRYSPKLQRLTANRVLKVLATLFLLSYTKVLMTICQVLFFFSTVTQLPSKHATLVWSISANIVPFGVKFCILYIICLILFIILLIFNALLLFPRTASRWSFINYFKPLLDAYFGPYKQKYPFWTGLQLFIRSCFFGLSALSRNVSLCSGAFLVGIVFCVQGTLHPFKCKYKNFQELLILLDILGLYVTALYSDNENNRYKILITRLLIITVLVYFIGLIFCHCVMIQCGDTIKQQVIKIKGMLRKVFRIKQTTPGLLHMEQLHSTIPEVTFNYKEFQEPMVALD